MHIKALLPWRQYCILGSCTGCLSQFLLHWSVMGGQPSPGREFTGLFNWLPCFCTPPGRVCPVGSQYIVEAVACMCSFCLILFNLLKCGHDLKTRQGGTRHKDLAKIQKHEATIETSQACLLQQSIKRNAEDAPINLQEMAENIVVGATTFPGYKLLLLTSFAQ